MKWRVLDAMDGHSSQESMRILENVRLAELQNAKMGICSKLQNRTSGTTTKLVQNEKTQSEKPKVKTKDMRVYWQLRLASADTV
jgi:hypothetical protein